MQKPLSVISVITGNDKNPGFRSCTKKHALTTYKEMVKDGKIGDLADEHGCFPHNIISQAKYKEFVAAMYFRLYMVEIKSLGLTWESFFNEGLVNLKLHRDVGIRKFKGKAFMYVPVQGVLNAAFKRVIYQVKEYDQISVNSPGYPDPLDLGFKEIGDGILTPILNEDFEEGSTVIIIDFEEGSTAITQHISQ